MSKKQCARLIVLAVCGLAVALVGYRIAQRMREDAPPAGPSADRPPAAAPAAGDRAAPRALPALPPSPNANLFFGDGFAGSFLQLLGEHRDWSVPRWREEFVKLRQAGMDMVIVQWIEHEKSDFAAEPLPDSVLGRLLAAADAEAIRLYVGLSLRKSWGRQDSFRRPYMREELARNERLARRVHPLLAGHDSFAGWYIPHEVSDIGADGERTDLVLEFFASLSRVLRELEPLKPIVASGYTDPEAARPTPFVMWWTLFARESGVDVLIFQDGAGLARSTPWQKVLPLIESLDAVTSELHQELWLVVETFRQTHGRPIDERPFAAEPADFDRVRGQIDALARFNKGLIAYSYFDYMRPSAGPAASALYADYLAFIAERSTADRQPTSAPAP